MSFRPTFLTLLLASCLLLPSTTWSQAQPKQPAIPLKIGKETVRAEVVFTPSAMQRGLMFREELGPNEGMLFVYAQPQPVSFWMKNTSLPLSIAYIDAEGVIVEIHRLEPFNETPVESTSKQIRFALEMTRDWFESRGFKPGTKIEGLPKLKS